MSRSTLSLRSAVLIAAAFAAPAALRAQATTPKVFYACYVPSSGTTYRIKEVDLKQQCSKTTHVQFSWTDGTSTPGFSQTMTVEGATVLQPAGNAYAVAKATCPAGTTLVGGGYFVSARSGDVDPFMFGQFANGNEWQVYFDNSKAPHNLVFTAKALCAK